MATTRRRPPLSVNIFRATFRGYTLPIVLVGAGLFSLAVILAYTFQAFGGLQAMEQLMKFVPESMQAFIKAQGGLATTPDGYMAITYRHPVYVIGIAAFIIGAASSMVAREVERGSILLVLASPLQRWRFLASKLSAMLLATVILLAVTWAGTWMGTLATGLGDQVDMGVFVLVQINGLALALAIAGYAVLISALVNEGSQSTGWAAGITVIMFFTDYLATLWSKAAFLGPFSIFHYYDPQEIIANGGLDGLDMTVLLVVACIGLALAFVGFQRRDIAR